MIRCRCRSGKGKKEKQGKWGIHGGLGRAAVTPLPSGPRASQLPAPADLAVPSGQVQKSIKQPLPPSDLPCDTWGMRCWSTEGSRLEIKTCDVLISQRQLCVVTPELFKWQVLALNAYYASVWNKHVFLEWVKTLKNIVSPGNSSQYPVINQNGKESEKECICMYNWITLLYSRNEHMVNQLQQNRF